MHGTPRLTPEILLRAYAEGLFPMAEQRDDPALYWVSPEKRGIIPLDDFHVPRRLSRTIRSGRFQITSDLAFGDVMRAGGHAHSLECWQSGELAGGLYGVSLGGVFFGESMFSRARDASKVALV